MKEYYYQIKTRNLTEEELNGGFFGGVQNWSFPPIFQGKVQANDKKEAKVLIEQEYGKQFPLRVLSKDIEANYFLLKIDEITEKSHYKRLFEPMACENCGGTFYLIERYNDRRIQNAWSQYCSDECKSLSYIRRQYELDERYNLSGIHNPVIYKITHKETGLAYIGKTTQAFTLRWYQHFFQTSDTAFHKAIKESKVSDWTFEVVESVRIPKDLTNKEEIEKYIIERERYYIELFDSIKNGYNSKY